MGNCFYCSKAEPVVQTKAGKIRGFKMNSTYTFHGIKYADADRFQMPREVKPWKGIKNALAYGYVCPMLMQDHPLMEAMIPHRYWPMDENCQYLNIWTQSLDPEAKKPVMVWLHGGGFFAGSSIEQVAYEGDHLSEYGNKLLSPLFKDVVKLRYKKMVHKSTFFILKVLLCFYMILKVIWYHELARSLYFLFFKLYKF